MSGIQITDAKAPNVVKASLNPVLVEGNGENVENLDDDDIDDI